MDWFRWWHGTVTDPKFQWVARKSGQPVGAVIAVWAALLECASTATQCNADATRGDVASFGCNDMDVLLGFEDGITKQIFDAMVERKLVTGDRLTEWDARQPKREDSGNPSTGALSSTERSRVHREKKKLEATHATNMQRSATAGNDRLEERREEPTHTPSASAQVSMVLRRHSIDATPFHPSVIALAEQGISLETLEACCAEARKAKPNESLSVAYIVKKLEGWKAQAATVDVRGVQQKPKAVSSWTLTLESMRAKARELKISDARPGESVDQFKARIIDAINAQEAA